MATAPAEEAGRNQVRFTARRASGSAAVRDNRFTNHALMLVTTERNVNPSRRTSERTARGRPATITMIAKWTK